MKNKKSETKFYNVLFPFWMLLIFPQTWLVVLPGNFIIDSVVLLLLMAILKIEERKSFYKRHILKIFAFGMLSDFAGALYMLFMMLIFEIGQMGDEPYLTLPALVISAALIFLLNYSFTFKKSNSKTRMKLSLAFAAITAPYTFLIPSSWLYR